MLARNHCRYDAMDPAARTDNAVAWFLLQNAIIAGGLKDVGVPRSDNLWK